MANTSSDFALFNALFKSNLVKGANAIYGIARNNTMFDDLVNKPEAMTAIFEPNTAGGAAYSADAFMASPRNVGKGIKTFVRASEPTFDSSNILDGLNTLEEIVANATAQTLIAGSKRALLAIAMSPLAMEKIYANTNFQNAIRNSSLKTTSAVTTYSGNIQKEFYKGPAIILSLQINNAAADCNIANGFIISNPMSINSTGGITTAVNTFMSVRSVMVGIAAAAATNRIRTLTYILL